MADHTTPLPENQTQPAGQYPQESLLHPGANLNFLVWLAVVGLPALLLFLILSKHAS